LSQTQTLDHQQTNDFKAGVEKLSDRTAEVKENLAGLAHEAALTAKAGAHDLSKGVKNTVEAGRKSAADAIEGVTDRIAENPLTAVGVAIGVGVVIGYFLRRPRG
jgi:ElaB/YqjD/DUF883 family membrane-anchored ribosome-binding protein